MRAYSGRAWVFGDNIDTDALAPGAYMKRPIEELAAHCMEALSPDFASNVEPGDVVVGGRNFGMGSSREQAAEALRHLGVRAVVARSFAGIFYRNALNLGLLAVECDETGRIAQGDELRLDAIAGTLENMTQGVTLPCKPVPPFLMEMVDAGGLVPHLENRFRSAAS